MPTLFEHRSFLKSRFWFRILNTLLSVFFALPILLWLHDGNDLMFWMPYGIVSLLVFSPVCLAVVALGNMERDFENAFDHIVTYILAPTLLVTEPIFILIWHLATRKRFKRERVYQLLANLEG